MMRSIREIGRIIATFRQTVFISEELLLLVGYAGYEARL
jgi:hypothetical protein